MKREIKFRVWDDFTNEMFYVEDFYFFEEHGIHNSNECKLMQFTGLKDGNGRDIYECDIVTSNIFIPLVVEIPQIYYNTLELNVNGCEWEVIGNIYENPELLNN